MANHMYSSSLYIRARCIACDNLIRFDDKYPSHRLPSGKTLESVARLARWCRALNIPIKTPDQVKTNDLVCYKHFDQTSDYGSSNRLKDLAIPVLSRKLTATYKSSSAKTAAASLAGQQAAAAAAELEQLDHLTQHNAHFGIQERETAEFENIRSPGTSSNISPAASVLNVPPEGIEHRTEEFKPAVVLETPLFSKRKRKKLSRGDDPDYKSEHSLPSSGSLPVSSGSRILRNKNADNLYLVEAGLLGALFDRMACEQCSKTTGHPYQKLVKEKFYTVGAVLHGTWRCSQGHRFYWSSSSNLIDENGERQQNLYRTNVVLPSAVVLNGATYTKFGDICNTAKIQIHQKTHFTRSQNQFIYPAVMEKWNEEKNSLHEQFSGAEIQIGMDCQYDSPGYSAGYGTVSAMELNTGKMLDFEVVSRTECKSSPAIEEEATKRLLTRMRREGYLINSVCTDSSSSVLSLLKTEPFCDINHQLDIWHLAKNLDKRLKKIGQRKDNQKILAWRSGIRNHLFACCQDASQQHLLNQSDKVEYLTERWLSLLYHIKDIHEWGNDQSFTRIKKCAHEPRVPEDDTVLSQIHVGQRVYFDEQSRDYESLTKIVRDPYILKSLQQCEEFLNTSKLECFHSVRTNVYLSKKLSFDFDSMRLRTVLACLDTNQNVDRQPAKDPEGNTRKRTAYSRQMNRDYTREIKVPKSRQWQAELREEILRLRSKSVLASRKPSRPAPLSLTAKRKKDSKKSD